MNITMTVTAGTADELFSSIKGMSALIREDCPAVVPIEPATPALAPSVPQQAPIVPPQAPYIPPVSQPQAPIPPVGQPSPVAPPPTAPIAPPTAPAPSYTLDQLNRAGADLITAHPETMPQLNALMGELGVQTLAQLKPEMYGTVALRLRGLGAAI